MNWKSLVTLFGLSMKKNTSKNINSDDPEEYYSIAMKKMSENDETCAMDYFNKTIGFDDTHSFAYYHRGLLNFNLKKYDRSISDFNKAISLKIVYDKECFDMGLEKYFSRDFEGAKKLFSQAVVNPIFEKLHYNNGLKSFKESDWLDAIQHFDKVLELSTSGFEAYYFRGISKFSLQNYNEALQDFNNAINLKPTEGSPYYYRGKTNFTLENLNEAISDFDKALLLKQTEPDIYFVRGLAKSIIGKKDEATIDLLKASDLGFEKATVLLNRLRR